MRARRLYPLALSLFFLSPVAASRAQDGPTPGEKRILEELKSLRQAVEALNTRLEAIEKRLEALEEEPDVPAPFFPGGGGFRGAKSKDLEGIALPPNPTREQVREYVSKIKKTSEGSNFFSSGDPQIDMLAQVPREHLGVLVEEMEGRFPGMTNYHVLEALKRMVTDGDLPLIRDALAANRELVALVREKGWEKEVEDVLVQELESGDSYLPTEWIQAVARLGNPATYPGLLRYLREGHNPSWTLQAIESIPGFPRADLEAAVGELWEKKKSGEGGMPFGGPHMEYERAAVAKAAARFGHVDALEYCIRRLNEKPAAPYDVDQELRPLVLKLVPVRLSNKELLRWYNQHRGQIVFDRETGTYRVEREEEPDEGEGF